ncbi:hypothetical protein FAVG1_08597 [Fusarium avenaceum]|nr:hypothetical protein FAVG1_08597 [Fusarium avenaceum]
MRQSSKLKIMTPMFSVAQKSGTVLFMVQISGIPSNLMGQELRLQTDNSQSFWYQSQDIQPNLGQNNSSNIIEFSMTQVVQTGVNPLNPWCIKGLTQFHLYTVDSKGDLTIVEDQPDPVPLEL